MTRAILLLTLLGLFAPNAATAVSCADGKTADNITPQSDPDTWAPFFDDDPATHTYAAANGIWSDYPGNVLEITGNVEACLVGGGYDGTLTTLLDADTYYERHPDHGCVTTGCGANQCLVGGTCRASYFYHNSNAGLAPNNSWETNLEKVQISNQGDGISLESGSSDVTITGSWLKFIHDDAIETDWCHEQSITVTDTLIDNAFLLFAWDVRSNELPCSNRGLTFYIDEVIGSTYKFTHSHGENTEPGVFKDDGGGLNADLGSFTNNLFLFGPTNPAHEAGDQKMFPDPDWLTGPCENVVYLWRGTSAQYDDMLAEANNGADLDALDECITVEFKQTTETQDEFLNRDFASLDNQSYNDIRGMWINGHFGSAPGCGVGPELVFLLPLLGWIRRRAR